jgi:tRNA threonylcarbamoyladenosine biosynthesis protein TsaE
MRALGCRIGGLLRPGDLVVLTGPLGAGKTTLAQGIGEGLGVRGPVTSPTFVIARVHPSLRGGPTLVHADAYRLSGRAEVDDLDLDADLDSSVTVVEWGEGMVEELASSVLQIRIAPAAGPGQACGQLGQVGQHEQGEQRDQGSGPEDERQDADDGPEDERQDADDEPRTVSIIGTGDRWEAAAGSARLDLAGGLEVL